MKILRYIAAIPLSLVLVAPALAAKEEIVVNGSTTVLPVMQKAAENFMAINPDVTLSISGGGSGNGIKALTDGLCLVAMSSRDMKANETELAKSKGVNPTRIPIAVDALVPIVHPSNGVAQLSIAQLRDIYAGRIVNWKEVGGADKKIAVISRDTSSGTYETWDEKIMSKERVAPSALLQASNGAVVQAVSKNPNAVGYIGFGYRDKSVKGLDIGGQKATPESALSGQWPIARELYIFTNGEPKGAIKKLVDYLLDPQKGQKAVLEVGFIPLPKK
ncbi:MAG: phosphate ABC transporter substrate-binding protein [Deltaproteobacteria bacterium]|jgi:phosphate transport system substrate-binding protein|nr:phosphate ABC transporter substrate-binding protein [Deltaproteobacteria bacterium]